MTTYAEYEAGIQTAKPVEAYKFTAPVKTYCYTSSDVDVTIAGVVYTAIPIKRAEIAPTTQEDAQETLQIEIPFNESIVEDFGFTSSPPSLDLEIWRVHWGMDFAADAVRVFSGSVINFNVDNQHAKLICASVFAGVLASPLPPRYWQKPCNHVLFDGRCGANATPWTATTTAAFIDGNDIVVAASAFSDGVLAAGVLSCARTGEKRMIIGNVATLIKVNFPFNDMRDGDTITLQAGCDHSMATCKAKFGNLVNFGGHPYIPSDNPFMGEL